MMVMLFGVDVVFASLRRMTSYVEWGDDHNVIVLQVGMRDIITTSTTTFWMVSVEIDIESFVCNC